MDRFAEERKQELYGAERNLLGSQLRAKLTESNILRDGEFNINKNSATPGFQWSSVTLDDYKRVCMCTMVILPGNYLPLPERT